MGTLPVSTSLGRRLRRRYGHSSLQTEDEDLEFPCMKLYTYVMIQMGKYTRFHIKKERISPANAIILFNLDLDDRHLYSFELATNELKKMQAFPDFSGEFYRNLFSTLMLGHHIYILKNKKVLQLNYSDLKAVWRRLSDMNEGHGSFPSATAFKGSIYVCGSSHKASRSVSQFEELENEWLCAPDMNIAREDPCVVATEDHIYCIGGKDEKGNKLRSVEKFDGIQWEFVEQVPRGIVHASVAVLDDEIYVSDNKVVQCYNIQKDSWREANLSSNWPFRVAFCTKIVNMNNELYIIGYTNDNKYAIYMLDPETDGMTFVHSFDDMSLVSLESLAAYI